MFADCQMFNVTVCRTPVRFPIQVTVTPRRPPHVAQTPQYTSARLSTAGSDTILSSFKSAPWHIMPLPQHLQNVALQHVVGSDISGLWRQQGLDKTTRRWAKRSTGQSLAAFRGARDGRRLIRMFGFIVASQPQFTISSRLSMSLDGRSIREPMDPTDPRYERTVN